MRKSLLLATIAAATVLAGGTMIQAQPYGPGMMGGGYGPGYGYHGGYGMMGGYGPGYMMGPGYGYGMMNGYGPGYMAGPSNGAEPGYRGQRLCWQETDATRGYGRYVPCGN
jgi:hypothetical protein